MNTWPLTTADGGTDQGQLLAAPYLPHTKEPVFKPYAELEADAAVAFRQWVEAAHKAML